MDLGSLVLWVPAALAVLALWRAYVPPQQRSVNELRERVEEAERDLESLHERWNKNASKQNMDKARAAHEERVQRRNTIEEQAMQLIAASKATQPPQQQTPEQVKAALRARLLNH